MQAIAQSTNALVGSPSLDSYDFAVAVREYATMSNRIKGNTKDVVLLKRQKLISGVAARFRDLFPSVFAKRDEKGNIIEASNRIPAEYFDKIVVAVDNFCSEHINALCRDTMTYERKHVHRAQKQIFVETRIIKDEREIPWAEQYTACRIAQGNVRRRKENLEKDNKLSQEALDLLRKQMRALNFTMDNIKSHLPADELEKFNKIEAESRIVNNDF